jgi:hypothetical protein
MRKGSPVCPEKKRSPPNVNLFKMKFDGDAMLVGKGPICVSVIKNDRMTIKSETLFRENGTRCGLARRRMETAIQKSIDPYTKTRSTSNTGMLLKIMSVTGLLALSVA